jgi:hypothetical protein
MCFILITDADAIAVTPTETASLLSIWVNQILLVSIGRYMANAPYQGAAAIISQQKMP